MIFLTLCAVYTAVLKVSFVIYFRHCTDLLHLRPQSEFAREQALSGHNGACGGITNTKSPRLKGDGLSTSVIRTIVASYSASLLYQQLLMEELCIPFFRCQNCHHILFSTVLGRE